MTPPITPPNPADDAVGSATLVHQVGPYEVSHGRDELILRQESRGELTMRGCFFFGITMLALMTMGVLSIIQTAESTPLQHQYPSRFFDPAKNHFGFLWLVGSIMLVAGIPFYVYKSAQAVLTFTFRRSDDVFLRDKKIVSRLSRIEYFQISESKDPDGRYLYLLNVAYNDGEEMLLHNGYDEREVMNLANELSRFVGCPSRFA